MNTTALKTRTLIQPMDAAAALGRVVATIQLWGERARQRRHLAEMSPEMLYDIGVSVSAARSEAAKPFWRA